MPRTGPESDAWKEANVKPTGRTEETPPVPEGEKSRGHWETEKAKQDARFKKLKADQLEGRLIEKDIAIRLLSQQAATAKAHFEQVPDRALALLPKNTSPAMRTRFLDSMNAMVADVLETMAVAVETGFGDSDFDDPEEDDRAA